MRLKGINTIDANKDSMIDSIRKELSNLRGKM